MKLSVSVPDELWERARGVRPDLKDSRLVQTALDAFTRPAEVAGYSTAMPEDAKAAFEAVRDKLAARARTEFEDGYRAAIELVPTLDWWDIQSLAERYRFAVKEWAQSYADSVVAGHLGHIPKDMAAELETVGGLVKALGNVISPFGDNEYGRTVPFLRGFAQAFRELWDQVNQGEASANADPGGDVPASGEGALGE
jgi:hypothetical protein